MVSQPVKGPVHGQIPCPIEKQHGLLQAIPLLRVKSDKLPLIHQRQFFIETKTKIAMDQERQTLQPRIQGSCTI